VRHLSVRTVFATILTLSAIEVIASSSAAAGRVGGALQGLSTAARYLMSPAVPLIPDLRTRKSGSTQSTALLTEADLTIPSLPPVQG